MRSKLLRCIYYVTVDHFVTIPQDLTADLAYHGIKIYQVPYHSIDRFLPPKNLTPQSCLILCDIPELVQAFLASDYYVVAVLHEDNKDKHFNVRYAVEDLFANGVEKIYTESRPVSVRLLEKMGAKVSGETFPFYKGTCTPIDLCREDYLPAK